MTHDSPTEPASASTLTTVERSARPGPLPIVGLLALTMTGFVVILTEALPAGLLAQMAASLNGSEAMMGQLITVYAVGSLLAAIPLTAATQHLNRRPLLLAAIVAFGLVNAITALADNYYLILCSRLIGGVAAGLVWSLIAGFAGRMVPAPMRGRAIAIALAGTPLALTLGIPAGTFIGQLIGWRGVFGLLSAIAGVLVVWIVTAVPDFAGQRPTQRRRLRDVFILPGLRPLLLVALLFVIAHNVLYTYISPLLGVAGLSARTDVMLLMFGATALISIWGVGMLADRWMRALVYISIVLFVGSAVAIALFPYTPGVLIGAIVAWGLAFGGAGPLFNAGVFNVAGNDPGLDVAQSMMVTNWNIAIASGGLIGGLVLGQLGAQKLTLVAAPLLIIALAITWKFPAFAGPARR